MRAVIFFLCLVPAILPGQNSPAPIQETFSLRGGTFHEGSVMRRRDIYFDLSKASLRPETKIILDSIAVFLLMHPELTIEVGNHSNYVNPNSSFRITQARACAVSNYLISKTIPSSRLICKGYGDQRKLASDSAIARAKTLREKDSLRALNYRTEFRIIAVDPNRTPQFTLTDTTFFAGQIWRGCPIIYGSKNEMRYEDRPCLDSLAALLNAYPDMRIEIGSHTDSRGSEPFNQKLSQTRAQFVADYLINEKGIAAGRIIATGYGESVPLIEEAEIQKMQTKAEIENAHQQNRRTEFKIISVN